MDENKTQKETDKQSKSKQLHFLYGRLFELIIHEGRYVSERTNAFLIFNGILFAGFSILKVEAADLTFWTTLGTLVIAIVGLYLVILFILIFGQNVYASNYWKKHLQNIEKDADFWYPLRKSDVGKDMDIFTCRDIDIGESNKKDDKNDDKKDEKELAPKYFHGIPINGKKITKIASPNIVLGLSLPILLGGFWLFACIWAVNDVLVFYKIL